MSCCWWPNWSLTNFTTRTQLTLTLWAKDPTSTVRQLLAERKLNTIHIRILLHKSNPRNSYDPIKAKLILLLLFFYYYYWDTLTALMNAHMALTHSQPMFSSYGNRPTILPCISTEQFFYDNDYLGLIQINSFHATGFFSDSPKSPVVLKFSVGIEKDQWYEMR